MLTDWSSEGAVGPGAEEEQAGYLCDLVQMACHRWASGYAHQSILILQILAHLSSLQRDSLRPRMTSWDVVVLKPYHDKVFLVRSRVRPAVWEPPSPSRNQPLLSSTGSQSRGRVKEMECVRNPHV